MNLLFTKKKLFLLLIACTVQVSFAQVSHIDFGAGKENLRCTVRWKNKGLIFLGRNREQTAFHFVNSSGINEWNYTIKNDAFQCGRAKSTAATNSNHLYFIAYVNDKVGAHVYLYVAGEDGKFRGSEKQYDRYRILAAEVTDEGAILIMKDNAKKEADRDNRIVLIKDESGDQSVSVDIQLPEGLWSPQSTFHNSLVLLGNDERIDAGFRKYTVCFLDASGQLKEKIVLELKLPEGQSIHHSPRFYFDEDADCIYAYFDADEKKDSWPSRFCIIKYDASGKIIFSLNQKYAELTESNGEPLKKGLYNDLLNFWLIDNPAWGGLAYIFESWEHAKKTMCVLLSTDGKVKHMSVNSHLYINEKYFMSPGSIYVPPAQDGNLYALASNFITHVVPSLTENPDPYKRISTLKGDEKKPKSYFDIERVGTKDFILEYSPNEALVQIYN